MPNVRSHTRKNGTKVKAHYRLLSRWNFGFGLFLMVLFFAVVNRGR